MPPGRLADAIGFRVVRPAAGVAVHLDMNDEMVRRKILPQLLQSDGARPRSRTPRGNFTPGNPSAVTPEISALARSLKHDPELMAAWVQEHIQWEPIFGSVKGAAATLIHGAGNDFDQSSLLVALLRARDTRTPGT